MSERIHYYMGAIIGAYFAIFLELKWWSPLVWAVIWTLGELVAYIVREKKRNRKVFGSLTQS